MYSLKVKVVSTTLLVCLGYFIVTAFWDFITPAYSDPLSMLSLDSMAGLVIMTLILSFWAYATIRSFQLIYDHLKHGSLEEQRVRMLDKKMKSMDIFLNVAQKEFMKRKISKKTFEDIQRIAGKKIVEIKAKKKELAGPEDEKKQATE